MHGSNIRFTTDTPSVKLVSPDCSSESIQLRPFTSLFVRHIAQRVASVLPVLMSAIRVSPPSAGPAHNGKEIGKDKVTYTYNQVSCIFNILLLLA